jgi:hypothetical protein
VIKSGGQRIGNLVKSCSTRRTFVSNQNHSQSSDATPVGERAGVGTLEQRLAARPHLRQRIETILDTLERDIANGVTADEAEAHAREQVRALGQELLQDWAGRSAQQAATRAAAQHPQSIKHRKKNSSGIAPSASSK